MSLNRGLSFWPGGLVEAGAGDDGAGCAGSRRYVDEDGMHPSSLLGVHGIDRVSIFRLRMVRPPRHGLELLSRKSAARSGRTSLANDRDALETAARVSAPVFLGSGEASSAGRLLLRLGKSGLAGVLPPAAPCRSLRRARRLAPRGRQCHVGRGGLVLAVEHIDVIRHISSGIRSAIVLMSVLVSCAAIRRRDSGALCVTVTFLVAIAGCFIMAFRSQMLWAWRSPNF